MEIIHVEVNPEVGKREFEKYKQTLFLSPLSSKVLLHIDKMLKKASKLKSIIKSKAKTNINISPASEAMIELLTLIFLNGLAQEAKAKAFEEKSATIRAQHLKAVSKKMLKKARG